MRSQQTVKPGGGGHVYDDEQDMWFEFDDQNDLDAFVAEASNESATGNLVEESRGAANLGAYSVPVTTLAAVLLPFDPTRSQVRLAFFATTGFVLIGKKESVNGSAPNGFRMISGQQMAFDAQTELWVVGGSTISADATLSVFFTTLLP